MNWSEVYTHINGKRRISGKYDILKSIKRHKGYQFIDIFLNQFVKLFIKANYRYNIVAGDFASFVLIVFTQQTQKPTIQLLLSMVFRILLNYKQ